MLRMPVRSDSPPDSIRRCWASGLVARKLAGDIASTHCDTAKRMRWRVLASASTASASSVIVRAVSR